MPIIFFLSLVFYFIPYIEAEYTLLKKGYLEVFEEKKDSFCSENLEDFFENRDQIERCIPPRIDHLSRVNNNKGAYEAFCLLLKKAGVSSERFEEKEGIVCSFL